MAGFLEDRMECRAIFDIRPAVRRGTNGGAERYAIFGNRRLGENHPPYRTNDGVQTNTKEGFSSQTKKGIRGVYHTVCSKYLQYYLNEFSYRYDYRKDVMPIFFSFHSKVNLLAKQA